MKIVYQLSDEEIGEAKRKAIRGVAQEISDALSISLQDVMKAFESIVFNIEEMKETIHELADYIIETEIENGWPLHPNKCRAGCTSKPIVKPPYWHRIRSYCVTNKYH